MVIVAEHPESMHIVVVGLSTLFHHSQVGGSVRDDEAEASGSETFFIFTRRILCDECRECLDEPCALPRVD